MVKCLPPLAALCAVAALAGTARASSMDTNAYMKTGVGLSLSKSNPAYGGAWDESVSLVVPEDTDAESARSITVNETLKAEYADADARRLSGSVSDQRNRLRQRMMEATSSDIEDLEEYFGVSMERSLSVLNSTYLSGEAPSVPWPSSYWPTFQDGINYEWAGEASPAEKYATAFGLDVTDFMDKVSKATGIDSQSSATKCTSDRSCGTSACAIRSGESSGYCIPTWYGICHAWAPAAILEAEPECPVTKNGVTFQVMDIKALLTQVYDDAGVSTVFTGARFNGPDSPASTDQYGRYTSAARRDLGPGFFHVAVTNIMGKHKQSFVLDVSSNSEVWNQPVRSYSVDQIDLVDTATVCAKYFGVEEYPFNSAAKHLAHAKMTVKWVVEAGQDGPLVSTGYVDSYTTSDQYEYLLELDDDYSIIGGEWLGNSQDDHPDFLWFATGKADKSTVTEVGLSYADVEELLNESVACGATTEAPTPTPTETPEATTEAPTATPEATTEAPTEAPTATPETTTATPVESSASGSDAGSNDIEIPTETPEVTTATPVETSESGSESGSDAGSESGSDATEAPTATPETTTATPVESSESGSDAGSDSTEAPTATPGATTAPTSTPVPTYTGGKGGKGGVVYTTPAPTTAPTTGATTAPTTAPPADGSDVDSDSSEANSGDDSDDSDDDEHSSSSDNDSTEAPAVTPASGKGGKGGVVYTTPAPTTETPVTTETPATTPVTTETPVTTPPTTTSGDENEKTPEPTTAAVTETPAATTTVPSTGSGNDETPAPTTTAPSTGSGNDETPAPTTTEVTTEAPATTPASGKGGKGGVVYTTPAPTTAEVTEVPSTGNSQESTPAPTTTAPSTESGDDESDDGDDEEVTPAPTTTEVTEAPTPAPTATGGETEEVTPAPTTVTETVAPTPAPTATGGETEEVTPAPTTVTETVAPTPAPTATGGETEEVTPAPTTVTVTDAPNTSTGDDVTEAPSTESPKDDMEYSTPAPTATTDVTDAPNTSTGDDETEAPTPAPTTSTDDDDDEDDDDDDDYTPGTTSPKDSMDYSTPAPTPAATTATSTGDSSNEQVTPAPTTVSGKDPHKICV